MDNEIIEAKNNKNNLRPAKECAFIATFVALVISAQLCLSFVPGVELVTILFVSYSYVFGVKRGMIAATVFSLVRQLVFGFYPTVLILYTIYYNFLTSCFGLLGKKGADNIKVLPLVVIVACICTVIFTMMDNVLTPLWYGYSKKSAQIYFYGSLPLWVYRF